MGTCHAEQSEAFRSSNLRVLPAQNEILRRSAPQNDVGQEPAMPILDVQLPAEKATQIHLVADALWMRVKNTGYLIADNGEAREV